MSSNFTSLRRFETSRFETTPFLLRLIITHNGAYKLILNSQSDIQYIFSGIKEYVCSVLKVNWLSYFCIHPEEAAFDIIFVDIFLSRPVVRKLRTHVKLCC